jgi:hypothetical protein
LVVKAISYHLFGTLTPSGVVTNVKVSLLSLAGAITPTGLLYRLVGRLAGGVLQLEGSVLKAGAIYLSGLIASVGSLINSGGTPAMQGRMTLSDRISSLISRTRGSPSSIGDNGPTMDVGDE